VFTQEARLKVTVVSLDGKWEMEEQPAGEGFKEIGEAGLLIFKMGQIQVIPRDETPARI